MPLIPILQYEAVVQIGDKTRFDASKSFATKDEIFPMTKLSVTPGQGPEIDVKSTKVADRYLDWVWSESKFDIDETCNRIDFVQGEVVAEVTITAGQYSLAELLTAIETAMNVQAEDSFEIAQNEYSEIVFTSETPFEFDVAGIENTLFPFIGVLKDTKESVKVTSLPVDYVRRKVKLTYETTNPSEEAEIPVLSYSKTYWVTLLTEEQDRLFSSDQDLIASEPEILKTVPQGRASYLNVHRKAQNEIVDWLDRQGYRDFEGKRLDKWAIIDLNAVRLWSTNMVLKLIYQGIKNAVDDVFGEKAEHYESLEVVSRNRAILELGLSKEDIKEKTTSKVTSQSWTGDVRRG